MEGDPDQMGCLHDFSTKSTPRPHGPVRSGPKRNRLRDPMKFSAHQIFVAAMTAVNVAVLAACGVFILAML